VIGRKEPPVIGGSLDGSPTTREAYLSAPKERAGFALASGFPMTLSDPVQIHLRT
jgi:hypothetical protein